jgi:hypothetical protein
MRFATALLGVAAAEHVIDIDWTNYAKSNNLVQSLIKSAVADKPLNAGEVTISACDDEATPDFNFDAGQTVINPSPVQKNSDLNIKLVGTFTNAHTVDNLHIHVDWNGQGLYVGDFADGSSYSQDYSRELKWYVPGYAPDGDYKVKITGTDGGNDVICVAASFTF